MDNERHVRVFVTMKPVATAPLSWPLALLLVLGYVLLDWASYFESLGRFNITPWNPAPALGIAFMVRHGLRAVPPLALAILLADLWVRDLPASLPVTLCLALLLTGGYALIARVLRQRGNGGAMFSHRPGLAEWVVVIVAGTFVNSLVFVLGLTLPGLLPTEQTGPALLRYWIGDAVGTLVAMPLVWMLLYPADRARLAAALWRWEMPVCLLATAAALWLAFGLGQGSEFKYFYVLFLPLVWIAARSGLAGAVLGAVVTQLGIIASVQWLGLSAVTVLEVQVLTVVLVLLGFFVGVVIDEHRQASLELRQSLRLAAAGEMAGALAHELNQPMTALSAYGAAVQQLQRQGDTGPRLLGAVSALVNEAARAAAVVHRLREFFRTGSTALQIVSVEQLLQRGLAPCLESAREQAVAIEWGEVEDCHIAVDPLQMQMVVRNLVANALDAAAARPAPPRRVRLSARREGASEVCVRVEDNGAGLSAAATRQVFEPFHSTKSAGLGLGLAISRSIAEAHGGRLLAEAGAAGLFRLFLPLERATDV